MPGKFKEILKSIFNPRFTVHLTVSLLFVAAYFVFCNKIPQDKIAAVTAAYFVLYVFLMIAVSFILRPSSAKMAIRAEEDMKPILGNITLDLIVKLNMPVVICTEDGKIVWYNNTFGKLAGAGRGMYGANFETMTGVSVAAVLSPDSDGTDVELFDRFFRIKGYDMKSHSKTYCLTVWSDCSELNRLSSRLHDEETLLAYIMVDNFDEILQYAKDRYRSASTNVEAALKSWASSVGGILKEYEREKYVFLFEARYMESFMESKFDILDKIREIRVGESNLPVTISIGIAQVAGTLADKDRAASAALDMALQRGGDQVVVKNNTGMDFYGGRTKTVQKRTKVRARVVANELAAQMAKSRNVLIMSHKNSDFDAIGACIGMARLVMFCGVEVHIIINKNDPNLARCRAHLEKLDEYADGSIFMGAAEAQDTIGADTLLIIVDVNNVSQFEAPEIAEIVPNSVIIDHHRKTAEFPRQPLVSYIEPSASSACELVAEILEHSLPSGMLIKEEADILYSGILLDTKQFTRNTGVRTFSAMLYLRGEGANPGDTQALFRTNLSDFMREARFESNVIIYRNIFAISANDNNDGETSDRIAAAKAADKLLMVDNVAASFALCRIGDIIHISARSTGSINVQLILEHLEGGGHYDSAATQVKTNSMTDALTRLKNAIDDYMNNN